ncbi:protein-glutamate methylesterase/protein-glutamine glutaminase [Algihabitans albus]|uniref:protein-glutamate methylesterase/protein-glutamine glutaminase n=1 Tax=Algihabitans albus TaxID=2164067 RepID=UPI001F1789A8|nr:chemotaxis response regulator protein-glutamate methylesterase [Algihabitans albus]
MTSSADPYRVMVVDDSAVIRGLLTRALEQDPTIEVVASVSNGQMALNQLPRQPVDVVVLDIEMPVMDGLTALPQLLSLKPGLQVIMASTLTRKNADVSLRALRAGAADYVAKPSSGGELHSADAFKRELTDKVKALASAARGGRSVGQRSVKPTATAPQRPASGSASGATPVKLRDPSTQMPEVLAIGSSTGGPQALFKLLGDLKGALRLPVLITQHMPATFTTLLAEHLGRASGMECHEGRDGEPLQAGTIYVAPGDWHMTVASEGTKRFIQLNQNPPENFCRPAVDPMLRSLAPIYGPRLQAVILTGMGSDGAKGCEAVVAAGGQVVAQDEASSVVWGMPGAVATRGLCTAVLPIGEISGYLRRKVLRSAA